MDFIMGSRAANLGIVAAAILLLVFLNVAVLVSFHPYFLPVDDAYITLHNAQVLWSGKDLGYGVPALIGATSLAHLAMVALFFPALGAGAAILVSFLGAAAYLFGVQRLAVRFGLGTGATILLLMISLGTGHAVYQLTNGLETSWVLAAVSWAIVLATGNAPSAVLAALCGILPFLRPELAVLSFALLARQTWVRWSQGDLTGIAKDIGLAAMLAAPWLLWTWEVTGAVLPNTAGAKVAFFAEEGLPLSVKLNMAGVAVSSGLGLIMIAPLLVRASCTAIALWAFAGIFLAVFTDKFPGGLGHNFSRYTYALLPVCLWGLCNLWANRRHLFWILGILLGLTAPFMIFQGARETIRAQRLLGDEFAAARWARTHIPSSAKLLIHDAGVIGYVYHGQLVDAVGLKTPRAAAVHERLTLPTGGAERGAALDQIARKERVNYAMILEDGGFWANLGYELRAHGWKLDVVRAPSVDHGYAIYRLTPPAALAVPFNSSLP